MLSKVRKVKVYEFVTVNAFKIDYRRFFAAFEYPMLIISFNDSSFRIRLLVPF